MNHAWYVLAFVAKLVQRVGDVNANVYIISRQGNQNVLAQGLRRARLAFTASLHLIDEGDAGSVALSGRGQDVRTPA